MPPRQPSSYNSSSITVLEGLEAVRKRPSMYIGSTGERGLHHLVWEVVDNSVDEALAGVCDTIRVTLLADGGVRVQDNGRGIPVDMHAVEKRPGIEVVLTTLHAGGKFDGKSYAVSGGLHGVGISVVNALSTRLEVEIHRDGYVWTQPYLNTAPAAKLHKGARTDETGTTITFWADDTIFESTSYTFETITSRLQEMAFLNRGLTIVIRDEREEIPVEVTYHYKGGIEDFVRHLNASKGQFHKSVIGFGAEAEGIAVEVAMQWNDSYGESVYTFANTINTHEGGTHEEGFRAALTTTINNYAEEKKLLKGKDDRLTGDDVREGLAAIVSVKLANPQFEGQTKTKLGNTEAKGFVQKTTNDWLGDWLERNPAEARVIITKASSAARARRAAQEARKLARKSLLTNSSLPGKLADCRSTDPRESEIYVVEGDSAGGCFVGSTQVLTAAGRSLSFAELAADWDAGVSHFGYASDENGDVVVVALEHPRMTRADAALVEVTLDEGEPIRCTPDHFFRLRDGSYRRADELQPDDSLMPLRRRFTVRGEQPGPGYEMVWANGRGRWEHTHHLADRWNLANGRVHYSQGPVRHHVDFDKRNNDPRNLVRMTQDGHIAHHAAHAHRTLGPLWKDPEFRERKLRSLSENAKKQWQDPEFRALKSEQVRRQRQDPELNQLVLDGFQAWLSTLDEQEREAMRRRLDEAQSAYWSVAEHRQAASERTRRHFQENPQLAEWLRDLAISQWSDDELRAWRSATTVEQWREPGRRERHSTVVRDWWAEHPEHSVKIKAVQQRNWADPEFAAKVRGALHDYRAQVPSDVRSAKIRAGHRRKALRLLNEALRASGDVRSEYERLRRETAPTLISYASLIAGHYSGNEQSAHEEALLYNHRVVGVRALTEREDVFDLTVAEHHNFGLAAGVFVHNSAKSGRDSMFQAILPIRGKIINVEKVRLDRALKNNEVQAMITALGTGIHDDFDITKLRYHKVVLMADADVDGQHIRTLLLTLLFRFMRPLIEGGFVYLAQPPLYKIKWGGKGNDEYAYTDRERDALIKVATEGGRRLPKDDAIQRYKGLGEMNAKELWETTMDPATRLLLQVTLDDAAQADALFSTLMGEDVEARRSFITRNARDVRFLDI